VKHPVGTAEEAINIAKGVVSAGTAVGTAVAGTVAGRVLGGASEAKNKVTGTTATETVTKAKETADKATDAAKATTDKAADSVKDTTAKVADVAKDVTAKAKGSADRATDAAETTTDKAADSVKDTTAKAADAAKDVTAKAAGTAKKTAKKASTGPATKKAAAKKTVKREPQVVLAEPAPPALPPIDVVGQALAAEAEEPAFGAGRTTEPRGASRDEEHGEAALQRAEAAEIAAEIAEASSLDLDIETPVGTTGAEVGNNPSTAEADLQQPGTNTLLDAALAKAVKKEHDVLQKAADPAKG
jgi:hypothetical protein